MSTTFHGRHSRTQQIHDCYPDYRPIIAEIVSRGAEAIRIGPAKGGHQISFRKVETGINRRKGFLTVSTSNGVQAAVRAVRAQLGGRYAVVERKTKAQRGALPTRTYVPSIAA